MNTAASTIRFAYATLDDVSRVAALIERSYRGPEAARGWTNEAALLTGPRSSEGEIKRLVRDGNSRFVLALEGPKLAGCARSNKTRQRNDPGNTAGTRGF